MLMAAAWPFPRDVWPTSDALPRWQCPTGSCRCDHEDSEPRELAILLHDANGTRAGNAVGRVSGISSTPHVLQADATGWLIVELPPHVPQYLLLEWFLPGVSTSSAGPYRLRLHVTLGSTASDRTRARLANLGYGTRPTDEENALRFERAYGFRLTGKLASVASAAINYHDFGLLPERPHQEHGYVSPPNPPQVVLRPLQNGSLAPGRCAAQAPSSAVRIRLRKMNREPCPLATARVLGGG